MQFNCVNCTKYVRTTALCNRKRFKAPGGGCGVKKVICMDKKSPKTKKNARKLINSKPCRPSGNTKGTERERQNISLTNHFRK